MYAVLFFLYIPGVSNIDMHLLLVLCTSNSLYSTSFHKSSLLNDNEIFL